MAKIKKRAGKPLLSRRSKIVLVVLLYFLGLAAGSFIIFIIPVMKYRAEMLDVADKRAYYTLNKFTTYPELSYGTEYYLYDGFGRVVASDTAFLTEDCRSDLVYYVPDALKTDSQYKVVRLTIMTDGKEVSCFGLLATVRKDSYGNSFAALVVRELSILNITTETFAVLYSIIFAAAVVLILYVISEQRELDRMRRDLIANVGHELKTPITSIRAMAEIIYDGMDKDPAARKQYSSRILGEADRLETLVTDILELSRLQSKKNRFEIKSHHIDGIVCPVIDRYAMMCADTGIEFKGQDMRDLEELPMVLTDPKYISMLMNILLDNAIKFTGSGGRITITKSVTTKHITFGIHDTGPGISPEDIGHIFDRFYKSDTAHNAKGSGLGLAIADEIAKGLGERLWVESEPGKGSDFYFTVHFA